MATKKEWLGLAVLALPCIVYAMDFTVLQLAIPHLTRDLAPTSSQLLWIMDIYGFLLAGALIMMGVLGDRIGRRQLLLIGAALFGAASLFAAFATSAETLIVARALLGLAAATLAPSTLSLISNMFHDPKQRAFAISVWITSFSLGSALGPLVGGALLMHFWWGSVFLVALPVMALLLIVGPKILPEYKNESTNFPDILSAGLSLASILLLVYGLKNIVSHGFDFISIATLVAGGGIGYWFVRRQLTLKEPFVDVTLFRSRVFSVMTLVYMFVFFVMFSTFYFMSQYLQMVRDMSSLEAGLWMLPWAIVFTISSMMAPRLSRRITTSTILIAGLGIAAVGLILLATIATTTPLSIYVVGLALVAVGFGPVLSLMTDIIIASVSPKRAGMASGISETASELGGALGIAVLGSIATFIYSVTFISTGNLPAELITGGKEALSAALQLSQELPTALGQTVIDTAKAAFSISLHWVYGIAAAVSFAGALLIASLKRKIDSQLDHND